MDSKQLQNIYNQCVPLLTECAEFILSKFGVVGTLQADTKSLNSLVSYVDIETEKKLVDGLQQIFPEADFITEENTAPVHKGEKHTWIIDPLDGTTNFLKGIPVFSISVALVKGSDVVLGMVYDVKQDDLYHAIKDNGAFVNDTPIHVSTTANYREAIIATGFPYKKYSKDNPMYKLLIDIIAEFRGIRRLGSAAIDLAYVARGVFDGYYEARLNAWDIAAGMLLVKEAGGLVCDLSGKSNSLMNGSVIAANHDIYEVLKNRIADAVIKDL